MKNDTIGNRTHDLQTCSAVPQPTAPPRAPLQKVVVPTRRPPLPPGNIPGTHFC